MWRVSPVRPEGYWALCLEHSLPSASLKLSSPSISHEFYLLLTTREDYQRLGDGSVLVNAEEINSQFQLPPLAEGKGPRGLMTVQAHTHMKLPKTGTATCTYFEMIELTAGEVEIRFIQKDLGIINEIESSLIEFANGNTKTLPLALFKILSCALKLLLLS